MKRMRERRSEMGESMSMRSMVVHGEYMPPMCHESR